MCGIIVLVQCNSKKIDLVSALECLDKLKNRGPDKSSHITIDVDNDIQLFMGFSRLAIMDTTDAGQQPFVDTDNNAVVCNGEIYSYTNLSQKHGFELQTKCDCEILLPLFKKCGFEKAIREEFEEIATEFATVYYNASEKKLFCARDCFGVRPLYWGYNKSTDTIGFASELKALHPIMEFVEQVKCTDIMQVLLTPHNNILDMISSQSYFSFDSLKPDCAERELETIHKEINNLFTEAVQTKLHADAKIGFLLSGGLDSSLIVSIAARILGPENIVCFSIGVDNSPDVEAAKEVVKYLGITQHHIVPFDIAEAITLLPQVIYGIETYDITTIRASTPQYVLAKYIREKTDIRVVLSGEGSDEINGSYRYFRTAPDAEAFHAETLKLMYELQFFDCRRTDGSMSTNGLEVRVPFLWTKFVRYMKKLDPTLLMYKPDYIEKKLLRDSFKGYLPDNILYRSKEAFSDAVSSNEANWASAVAKFASEKFTPEQLEQNSFMLNKPKTFDALYFRTIFDQYYPGRDNVVPHYWLPNFQNKEIVDPSARVLDCY